MLCENVEMNSAFLSSISILVMGLTTVPDPAGVEFFESKIRPVLVKECYSCHGEGKSIKGGLRLNTFAGLRAGGESGPAIVPGKPDESLLLDALKYESFEMPPARRLPGQVVANFEKWIRAGAPGIDWTNSGTPETNRVRPSSVDIKQGRNFWAFQPPVNHPIPVVSNTDWPTQDIDHFVLADLESHNLLPASDANRFALIRRLAFDLTGLPPTLEQLERFTGEAAEPLSDFVAELQLSPQFGEHWGRHWLDVARYGDSNGNDFNATFHNAWRYRNYVIDAFQTDKPYDQFVREQIAGDLLPYDSSGQQSDQIIATGFLMLGPKMLSERDKLKLEMDVVDEQIDTVGRVFMGLTLGCARCHDHKFDPIPATDYYALAGIFRSTRTLEGEMQKYVSDHFRVPLPVTPEQQKRLNNHAQQLKKLQTAVKRLRKKISASGNAQLAGIVLDDNVAEFTGEWTESTFSPNYVGKSYFHDNKQQKGKKSVTWKTRLPKSGRYEVRISFCGLSGRDKNVPVTIQHGDGTARTFLNQSKRAPIDNLFASLGEFHFMNTTDAVVQISNASTTGFVIADAVQFIPVDAQPSQSPVPKSLAADKKELAKLEAQLAKLKKKSIEQPRALAVADAKEAADCHLCIRGEHNRPGKLVPRGFIQVLNSAGSVTPQIPASTSGRLELANWIASPDNPLTARVIVNRVWSHLFGKGIVASVDNFGRLGDLPTHPELLDYLTLEFQKDGYSIKRLIRRIVLSRTYQQSAEFNAQHAAIDPENKWLWRANRRRLPVESIRDGMLQISNQLDRSPTNSTVASLGKLVSQNNNNDKSFQNKQSLRRTIFQPIIRNELPAMLVAFDFADPDMVVGRRPVTNVPSQALLLLNDPFVISAAASTAGLVLKQPASDRLEFAYLKILSRLPSATERQRAVAFLQGDSSQKDQARLKRWSDFIHALLASAEFRMLE